jgi:arylsulfatase A-like enzyme
LTVKALSFIDQQKDAPFFLYLNYTLPHFELTVPEDCKKQYENLGWPKKMMKKEVKGYQHNEEGNVTYAAMISRLDDYVGKILNQLKSKGIDENTLVILPVITDRNMP